MNAMRDPQIRVRANRLRGLIVLFIGAAVLLPLAASANEGTIERVSFFSEVLGRTVNVNVVLPPGYPEPDRQYPVVFGLHGGVGEVTPAAFANPLYASLLWDYGYVGIAPESYAPWGDSAERPGVDVNVHANAVAGGASTGPVSAGLLPRYEAHFFDELIPFVESHYAVKRGREGRAVLGQSGGGYGSTILAFRHPDRFAAVAAMSGVVNVRNPIGYWLTIPVIGVGMGAGDPVSQDIYWRQVNPFDYADNAAGTPLRIAFAAGDGNCRPDEDPVSENCYGGADFAAGSVAERTVRAMNDDLSGRLTELDVPHVYRQEAGVHALSRGAEYWHYIYEDVFFPMLAEAFESPGNEPPTWTYRTTDVSFEIWGVRFFVRRPNTEYLTVQRTGPDAFTLTGTGWTRVTTPADYEPGASYRVTRTGAGGEVVTEQPVIADALGRLIFTVALEPPRVVDQNPVLETSGQFPFAPVTIGISRTEEPLSPDPGVDCQISAYPLLACSP